MNQPQMNYRLNEHGILAASPLDVEAMTGEERDRREEDAKAMAARFARREDAYRRSLEQE